MKFLHLPQFSTASKFNEEVLLCEGATVAYDRPTKDTVRFAVAFASAGRDQFNKKKGRLISAGRLEKGVKVTELPAAPGKAIETIRNFLGA